MKTSVYVFVMLLAGVGSFAQSNTASADEKAIKNVIEQEMITFRQGKSDKVLSYWLNAPYISHSYTEKGSGYLRGYNAVSNAIKKYIGEHPGMDKDVYKNHDFIIHVNGNSAWATYITDKLTSTKKSQAYNARFVEKVNGVWKLVGVTGQNAPQ